MDVAYELVGISDGTGSHAPSPIQKKTVSFLLKKIGNQWKIARPGAHEVGAVVLESHF